MLDRLPVEILTIIIDDALAFDKKKFKNTSYRFSVVPIANAWPGVMSISIDPDSKRRLAQLAKWFLVSKPFAVVCRDIAARLFIAKVLSDASINRQHSPPKLADLVAYARANTPSAHTMTDIAAQLPQHIRPYLGRVPKKITRAKSSSARVSIREAQAVGYDNEPNLARPFHTYVTKELVCHSFVAHLWSLLGVASVFGGLEEGESGYPFPPVLLAEYIEVAMIAKQRLTLQ